MSAHVLTRVLPRVLAHLPEGSDWPDGVVATPEGFSFPLLYQDVVVDGTAWRRPHYVAYADGEPAVYHTPASFRAMVRKGTAWAVARRVEHVDLETASRQRGAAVVVAPPAP